jgi:hypothetical protein
VSSPSDPQPPVEPTSPVPFVTNEIPAVQADGAATNGHHGATKQLPPHPGAVRPGPAPMEEPLPTGPVDFVPGLPGTPPVPPPAPPSTTPPPPPPVEPVSTEAQDTGAQPVWPETLESERVRGEARKVRRARVPRNRAAVLGVGLSVLALVLLELGLALDFGRQSYWSAVPLWSAFATLCAVLAVVAFAAALPSGSRLRSGGAWRIAAAGLVGLAVFWVLVVLPVVASDRGFLLTAALGALGAAVWVGPGRKA